MWMLRVLKGSLMFAYETTETTNDNDMSIPKTAMCILDIQTKKTAADMYSS